MKFASAAIIALAGIVVGYSGNSSAESLATDWNVPTAVVRLQYPNAKSSLSDAGETLVVGPLQYGSMQWEGARFNYDENGRLSTIQLIGRAVDVRAVKIQMGSDRSNLWRAVDQSNHDGAVDDNVMLCTDGEAMTITYARPAYLKSTDKLMVPSLDASNFIIGPLDVSVSDMLGD